MLKSPLEIEKAIELLKQQGHTVKSYNRDGTFWFEIDGRMLVSVQQLQDLAERRCSVEELEALFQEEKGRGASSAS